MSNQKAQNDIQIVPCTEENLVIVRQIAFDTWPGTFGSILSRQQIFYMLEWMYSLDSLKKQVNDLDHKFLLAKDNDGYFGFASYEINYQNQPKTKIHKIYILPEQQGKGIGRLLIEKIKKIALHHQNIALILNVNRNNNATEMYKKSGFKIVKQEDIPIGNGFFMNDFVMEKEI